MQMTSLADWVRSPETQALLAYLRQRQAPAMEMFLRGTPVPPELQARASGAHEIERLLTSPVETINQEFEKALKGQKR